MAWASKEVYGVCVSVHERELVMVSQAAVVIEWQVVEGGLLEVVRVGFAGYLADYLTKPLLL